MRYAGRPPGRRGRPPGGVILVFLLLAAEVLLAEAASPEASPQPASPEATAPPSLDDPWLDGFSPDPPFPYSPESEEDIPELADSSPFEVIPPPPSPNTPAPPPPPTSTPATPPSPTSIGLLPEPSPPASFADSNNTDSCQANPRGNQNTPGWILTNGVLCVSRGHFYSTTINFSRPLGGGCNVHDLFEYTDKEGRSDSGNNTRLSFSSRI
jgi:hypothetical protein